MMQKTVLIVSQQAECREMLKTILANRYHVEAAEDYAAAIYYLKCHLGVVAAVLLEVIEGAEAFLSSMKADVELAVVPVLATAPGHDDEERVLALGARDYITMPWRRGTLLRRIDNLAELHESETCLLHMERDPLTGLYNQQTFLRKAVENMEANPDKPYTLVVTDVERFKLINDRFGGKQGDKLLKYIAAQLIHHMSHEKGICARLGADHFVALLPRCVTEHEFQMVIAAAEQSMTQYPLSMKISLKFGIYQVVDRDIPMSSMCDRALLAADSIKGLYHCACAFYDDSLRQTMLREQEITNAMKDALAEGQFKVFLQPKYDLENEHIAGAEALVRWIHPVLGFLSPGEFIPLFERNGFIVELDRYIWDKTCQLIASWIATKKKYVPVSVNVSRKDIYQQNLPKILMDLVKKHGLRPSQLHLEITESVYTENAQQIIAVVSELKHMGFIIEMDDFGTGYSSLNMLSELPIDVLKLDMRFIQKENERDSSRNILGFIVSLAKWMNLQVVAEGVETEEQVEVLRNIDCTYVQGFYYGHPMSSEEFTQLMFRSTLTVEDTMVSSSPGTLSISEKKGAQVMLIIDDVKLNRAILAEYFQNIYTIVQADNGQIAFEYIENHFDEIAVIMMDLVMPGMDGFQLLKKLRANPLYMVIPVIVTSQEGETSEAQAFQLGASDFLPKPYNMDIALHRVQNVTARNAVQTLEREKRMLSKMKRLAMEAKLDQLTGIYNRMEMERQVQLFFTVSESKDAVFFMLDIDNFKNINDVYGHDRGDEAIRKVATQLQQLCGEDDIVCRMGGDEFAVFIRGAWEQEQIVRLLDRICNRLRFHIEKTEVTCSIGVCVSPEYGVEYQDIYHNADVALLTSKRLGKNRWQIYGGQSGLPNQVLYRNLDWLLDESSDAIVVCDAETYETYYVNDVACALAGKDKKVCLSQPCYEAIWGNTKPCSHCVNINKLTRDYCEHEVQPNGGQNSYIIKGKLIDWGSRQARIQYIQDNTVRANLSRQMKSLSEERKQLILRLETIINSVPGALCLYRWDGKTLETQQLSDQFSKMVGWDEAEVERNTRMLSSEHVHPEDVPAIRVAMREVLNEGNPIDCVIRVFHQMGGHYIWLRVQMVAKLQEDGSSLIYALYTELTNLHRQYGKNKKLAE